MEETQESEEVKPAEKFASNIETYTQQAVCVRNAYKSYGTRRNPQVVLKGLNMTVPRGAIYGLLGASGCGKTTLLSCIVGRRKLDSGDIWVLGGRPGRKGSGVPGPRIGYMPQELALYGDFSIKESFKYFGWLSGMKSSDIIEKMKFFLDLLQLPTSGREVKNLSGGQQRRVSLAISLVHNPELLILDEPTVGVDPVLRENIWNHLLTLAQTKNVTVIITTHYIAETRRANLIGLMRGGLFLAEESPDYLLKTYNSESLEEVFLKLSRIQEEENVQENEDKDDVQTMNKSKNKWPDSIPQKDERWSITDYMKFVSPYRMKSLIWKNFLWMWRNVGMFVFAMLIPIIETILYCITIGQDPQNLPLSYVNNELSFSKKCNNPPYECRFDLLSCRFIETLVVQTLDLKRYKTISEAIDTVEDGKAWGALHFRSDFSQEMKKRIELGRAAENKTLDHSSVIVRMDMSNQHIGYMIMRYMIWGYQDFTQKLFNSCHINPKLAGIPLRFNKPIYGPVNPDFTNFAAPGLIITMIFFLATALTVGALLMEKKEGMLERCLVLGVLPAEILLSLTFTQFVVMTLQTAMVLIFSFLVFDIIVEGSIFWIVVLTLLNGLCGMCFGFLVASLCEEESTAVYLAMGSFMPIITLCGIVWPVEGMHFVLRYSSFALPLTFPTEAMRAMMARGWGIKRYKVYIGFISISVWTLAFLIASILILRFKKG